MADHRKSDRIDTEERYYDLKTSAMDRLVDAEKGKARKYSKEELDKYRGKRAFRFPDWLKIVLVKAWFAGAVCFFFMWGLGIYVQSTVDLMFIVGMALGFVTDILTNSVIRFWEKTPGENDHWMMFPKKRFVSLVLNVVYAYVILFLVYTIYSGINMLLSAAAQTPGAAPLGVEPILFGVLCMACDMLFVKMKQTAGSIVRDARSKADAQR